MKSIYPAAIAAIAAIVVVTTPAIAQQAKTQTEQSITSSPGRGEAVRTIRASATVTAIDKATRTISLKGGDGREFPIVAGPEVRSFDQLQVGSEVIVGYREALAIELKKGGGGKVELVETSGGGRAEPGAKPGGVVARKVTATGDVIALDAATQTATLRGPNRTVNLHVPTAKQFKLIAIGDQMQITYTEAVAVSVELAPKK